MGSIMRCCGKPLSSLFLACCWLLASAFALAADINARNAQILAGDDAYLLSADFGITLNPRLEEAVAKGVALYFVVDFELTRSRWYWLDEIVVTRSQSYQLSYHALTRQYRLYTGALHQTFPTLEDALRILERLRKWPAFDKVVASSQHTYAAAVRMRLDLSQMPKTFQVNALANRDWNLSSEWARWTFSPVEGAAPASPPPPPLPLPDSR